MKKIIVLILIIFSGFMARSQTVIPATTTVDSLSNLPKGSYRFYTSIKKDTVDLSKDTIPKCPVCPTCPAPVVCPPPIICPICPPPAKQRTATGITVTVTATNKNILITYDDGTTSPL